MQKTVENRLSCSVQKNDNPLYSCNSIHPGGHLDSSCTCVAAYIICPHQSIHGTFLDILIFKTVTRHDKSPFNQSSNSLLSLMHKIITRYVMVFGTKVKRFLLTSRRTTFFRLCTYSAIRLERTCLCTYSAIRDKFSGRCTNETTAIATIITETFDSNGMKMIERLVEEGVIAVE